MGTGAVGMACAYSILSKQACATLVLADIMRDKLKGEVLRFFWLVSKFSFAQKNVFLNASLTWQVMDFQHAGAFLHADVRMAGENYEGTEDSDVVIITAGVRQKEGEPRTALLERNYKVVLKGRHYYLLIDCFLGFSVDCAAVGEEVTRHARPCRVEPG